MESSLHRTLKRHYAGGPGGRVEVPLGRDRADALTVDGQLVEVQCGPTASLRPKLGRWLDGSRVRVVLPVVVARRIVRRSHRDGPDVSARFSPKRGLLFDAFEHLVGLAGLLPHPNLEVTIAAVEIDELRRCGSRGRSIHLLDRRLRHIVSETSVQTPDDLRALIPAGLPDPFSSRELAALTGRPEWIARRAGYCLRVAGAAVEVGRIGRFRGYRFLPASAPRVATGDPGCLLISSSTDSTCSGSSTRTPDSDIITRI
jgi:hypothetical protein